LPHFFFEKTTAAPYLHLMHTVVETAAYIAAARDGGVDAGTAAVIVETLAQNPTAGDVMVGTGGCRKVRFAGRGKGKSGGFRVITFYSGDDLPLFLLTVFSKGERPTCQGRSNAPFGR